MTTAPLRSRNWFANRHSSITIVAAITSKTDEDLYPTEVPMIRSIDKSRLVRRLGKVSTETMRRVGRAVALSVGLVEL